MVDKKFLKVIVGFYIFCTVFDVRSNWFGKSTCEQVEQKKEELLEKPPFFIRGYSNQGAYHQFNLYERDFLCGMSLAVLARTIAALAQSGTKFENFKVSVLKPGGMKFILGWGAFTLGYNYSQMSRENDTLRHQKDDDDSVTHRMWVDRVS